MDKADLQSGLGRPPLCGLPALLLLCWRRRAEAKAGRAARQGGCEQFAAEARGLCV